MPQNQVLVVILRRDEADLSSNEREKVLQAFPGKKVVFERTDPRDYIEHADQCQKLRPDAVLLPLERPIPSLAMEQGVKHIAFTPDGVMLLKPLVTNFEPFVAE